MSETPVFGFRYRYSGRNYALDVAAESRQEAEARVAAMAAAQFIAEFVPASSVSDTKYASPCAAGVSSASA